MKKGYQLTELGELPEDWKIERVSNISKVVRGGSPRPAGDPKFFNGNYIPWLTVAALTNISDNELFVSETQSQLTEEGSKRSRTLEEGTLIISNSGATLGVSKILSIKCCANDGIAALLKISKSVDKLFLCYFLNTKTKVFREVVATGNGQPNLNTTLIGSTKVALPIDKSEQVAIGKSLSDMDSLILSIIKLIDKKSLIKDAAQQRLLMPKADWSRNKLGKYIKFQVGFPFNSTFFNANGDGLRLIKNRDLKSNDTIVFYNGVYTKEFLVKNGDILIGMDGEFIPAFWDKGLALLNQRVGRLVAIKEINLLFLYYYLQRPLKKIEERTGSTTVKHLTHYDVENIELPLPSYEEQTEIANVLRDMDNEIAALEKKLEKYRQIKQGMMQQLLTGKIRLTSKHG